MYYTTQTVKVKTLFLEFPQNEKLKKATVRNQGKTVPCFNCRAEPALRFGRDRAAAHCPPCSGFLLRNPYPERNCWEGKEAQA